jgi:hypothetical protein
MNRSLAGALAGGLWWMLLGADCEGNVVADPTFRDWCGERLCAWRTDEGAISRVPTWNANDFGVSLLEAPTQISQDTSEASATCLLFTTVANIDASAEVTLAVDFDIDGKVERQLSLGATRWHRVELEITAPAAYKGIRFSIRKDGTGTAVVAEMRVRSTTGCTGPAPVLHDLVLGQTCASDGECESGVCGDVSGFPVCTQCSEQHPCTNGECAAGFFPFLQCGPGQHLGPARETCVTDSDCQSDRCEGTAMVPLAGEDAGICDLASLASSEPDASPSACRSFSNFGIHGGRCR